MSQLWAVDNDVNNHGDGGLNPTGTVYINGKLVTHVGTDADNDLLGHVNPKASSGSSTAFVYGLAVHRNDDDRNCGAKTVVSGQSTVFVG